MDDIFLKDGLTSLESGHGKTMAGVDFILCICLLPAGTLNYIEIIWPKIMALKLLWIFMINGYNDF